MAHFKEEIRRALRLQKQLPGYPLDANMFNKQSLATLLVGHGFGEPVWLQETPSFANLLARRHARVLEAVSHT
jgi:hypothetical protein